MLAEAGEVLCRLRPSEQAPFIVSALLSPSSTPELSVVPSTALRSNSATGEH